MQGTVSEVIHLLIFIFWHVYYDACGKESSTLLAMSIRYFHIVLFQQAYALQSSALGNLCTTTSKRQLLKLTKSES